MNIYRIWKNGTEEFIYRATVEKHRKQTYGHVERAGEGEMCGKSNLETYITICKIARQWEFAVGLRKLKQGLCTNLEGWDGEGQWREVQEGVNEICIPVADSC